MSERIVTLPRWWYKRRRGHSFREQRNKARKKYELKKRTRRQETRKRGYRYGVHSRHAPPTSTSINNPMLLLTCLTLFLCSSPSTSIRTSSKSRIAFRVFLPFLLSVFRCYSRFINVSCGHRERGKNRFHLYPLYLIRSCVLTMFFSMSFW